MNESSDKAQEQWQTVLRDLRLQMPDNDFVRYFHGSSLSVNGHGWVISCQDRFALDWVEHRLKRTVERTVASVVGQAVNLQFVLAAEPASPPPDLSAPPPPAATVTAPDASPITQISLDTLARLDHGDVAGYAKHSHYLAQFYPAYIGATAFDTWEYLRSHCKDSSLVWTEPVEVTGVSLARRVGCHVQRITGVYRNCRQFDQAYRETGELIECRQCHFGAKQTRTKGTAQQPQGRPVCRYWQPGALELLAAEGLAVFQKYGGVARNTFFSIQILQHLPLLVPRQAERLPGRTRASHRSYLRGMFKSIERQQNLKLGSLLAAWDKIDLYSLLAGRRSELLERLELPSPEDGVLSARARNNIFFACDSSAHAPKD